MADVDGIAFDGLTEPTKGASGPDWRLSGLGSIGAYCGVACRKFQPITYDAPDVCCAVCWGVLLTLGEIVP